jgi:hypothetical protein
MSPTLEGRVFYHLSRILYPPLSEKYLLPAIKAILLARSGMSEYKVRLPSGRWVVARDFIDYLFLSGFVNNPVD